MTSENSQATEDHKPFVLHLYVPDSDDRALRAEHNLRRFLENHLKDRYRLSVIDVFEYPDALEEQQLLALPTLIKKSPGREFRIVGDFSKENVLIRRLGVDTYAA